MHFSQTHLLIAGLVESHPFHSQQGVLMLTVCLKSHFREATTFPLFTYLVFTQPKFIETIASYLWKNYFTKYLLQQQQRRPQKTIHPGQTPTCCLLARLIRTKGRELQDAIKIQKNDAFQSYVQRSVLQKHKKANPFIS